MVDTKPPSVLFGVCRNCGKAIRTMPTTMLWRHDSNGYSNCPSTTLAEPRIEVTDEDRVRAQQDHQSCVRGLHSWTDHLPGRPDANAPYRAVKDA